MTFLSLTLHTMVVPMENKGGVQALCSCHITLREDDYCSSADEEEGNRLSVRVPSCEINQKPLSKSKPL